MLTQDRHTHLLTLLRQDGSIVAKTVSQDLGVSEDTIRRDLRALAQAGQLKRVHGGAVPLAAANAPFDARTSIATPEKAAIGRVAAGLIEPGQTVFLDGGTTAVQVVAHLPPGLRATVITHSPNVAVALMAHEGVQVEIVGGRLLRHSVVTSGAATVAWLARYRPDLCLIGATGLHPGQGITTGESEEAEVKRAIIARSGAAMILASSEKLGAVAAFEIATWRDIDGVVTAPETAAHARALLSATGCAIHA
ncbi:MAG: DeoR/GlpR family DNA-binding transcription regulator [Pseudomonadota bacterium]